MSFQIIIALASVAALFGMAYLVRRVGAAYRLSAETQRKSVHVGVGIHAMLLPLVINRSGFLVFAVLALVALLVLRLPKIATAGAGASIHSVERRSWGDVLFLCAVTVLFLRSGGDAAFYVLPLAVLTLSDAAAALIGTEYGRRRFGTDDRIKSVEGTVSFFVITWMVVVTILILATSVPRQNVIWLATVIAAMASIIEADSWHGLDNIFVPLGIHVFLVSWLHEEQLVLGIAAVFWLAALWGVGPLARLLRLPEHALRTTVVALFLIAGFSTPISTVFPILALAGHLCARRFLAAAGSHDLDFVAVLVLIGIFWFGVTALTSYASIVFYTMTFAALAASYAVLAIPSDRITVRLMAAVVTTFGVVLLHRWLSSDLSADDLWAPTLVVEACCAISVGCSTVGAAWRPQILMEAAPGFRLAGLALLFPALVYAWEVPR